MSNNPVFMRVMEIIEPYASESRLAREVTSETSLVDDLDINSARFVDIVIALEDAFEIAIDDEAADGIRTVGDAVALVESLKAA